MRMKKLKKLLAFYLAYALQKIYYEAIFFLPCFGNHFNMHQCPEICVWN